MCKGRMAFTNNEKLYLLKDFGSETITLLKCDTQIEPTANPLYIATYSTDKQGVLQKYAQDLPPPTTFPSSPTNNAVGKGW